MRPLTVMLCLLALLCNAAVASVGGFSICIGKDGQQWLSLGCAQPKLDSCCLVECATAEPDSDSDCAKCFDGRLDPSGSDDATSASDRPAAKAPAVVARLPLEGLPGLGLTTRPSVAGPARRAAPPIEPGARAHFARTVAFRL